MKNLLDRLSINIRFSSCLLSAILTLVFVSNQAAFCALGGDLPPESVKVLPMVNEPSVSTYIQGDKGKIAVNIMYPSMTRYDRGAPVAVVVPGNQRASGLSISAHTVQVGFCEVRFAFPGGGLKEFHTDGSWDQRGVDSQTVLKEVVLFACSKKSDLNGKFIGDLLPKKVDAQNVGLLSFHDGGNITLVTLAKFAKELEIARPNLRWLAFCEPQVGSFFSPSCMGTKKELVTNQYYKHGSAATGRIRIDFQKLAYQPDVYRDKIIREKQKMVTPKGVLFFDDNQNRTWEEELEFPLTYGTLPNTKKQYYAPEIVAAIIKSKMFAPLPVPKEETTQTNQAQSQAPSKGNKLLSLVKMKGPAPQPQKHQPTKSTTEKKEPEDRWPATIARLGEAEEYFQERDGSLYVDSVTKSFPNLLITIYGSKVDHNEQQPDHPNITYLYNLFLGAKTKWLRLNPDPAYLGFVADMNEGNFVNNKPNEPIDGDKIELHLESEGLVSDHVMMEAAISELADRSAANNLNTPLAKVIKPYLNEARILSTMNKTQKDERQAKSSDTEASSTPSEKPKTKPAKETPKDSNLRDEDWDWPAEFDEK